MNPFAISDALSCISVDVHTTELFEGIWPTPEGVTLNTYLVKGKKNALIDLVQDRHKASDQVQTALQTQGLDLKAVDYLILNHLEPDHTGWLKQFREKNPQAEIIATPKGINLVKSFYNINENLRAVKDGETLDLGNGTVLTFFETPNLHWPETMVTWEGASGTLFSCDAFGSFGALGGRLFDDEFSPPELQAFEKNTLRYYANIVASFSPFVEKAIQKLAGLNIACIAPSHGLVWRKNPSAVIQQYQRYASYSKGPAEQEIAVIWGSMYGNTKQGLEAVLEGIESEGLPYSLHRVPDDNISYILAAAFKSAGLVIAAPTYEYALFPPMAYVLDIFRRKHIHRKTALRIGSWGWSGGAQKEYDASIAGLSWTSIEPFEWVGVPSPQDLEILKNRGRALAQSIKT
ncbi:MAG: FprA family A-type flavoprotein [Spirochaetaceae bacterium]|jgi:flavorubredoxin|nr:FprA family A-type flavoprotein [Spirochaetaceae bacterium]